jgi:pSer/pThr/pTyr-binding forkhead associated (FHA) protein
VTVERSWTVGSSPECDIRVEGAGVSSKHCRLTQRGESLLLEDLGSTNGTFVDGERIAGPRIVRRSDSVTLGRRAPLLWPPMVTTVTIGRLPDNDIVIPLDMISAHHARLEQEGDSVYLVDAGSSNGTAVNELNNKITRTAIHPADQVFFGTHRVAAWELLKAFPKKPPLPTTASKAQSSLELEHELASAGSTNSDDVAAVRLHEAFRSRSSWAWGIGLSALCGTLILGAPRLFGPSSHDAEEASAQTSEDENAHTPSTTLPGGKAEHGAPNRARAPVHRPPPKAAPKNAAKLPHAAAEVSLLGGAAVVLPSKKSSPAEPKGSPVALESVGVAKPDVELPPVGPTPQPPFDPVVGKFKIARAAYLEARWQARTDLRARFMQKKDEMAKSNLDAMEKEKIMQALWKEHSAFQTPHNDLAGPIYSHPAVQDALADYWRNLKTAADKFAAAADEGLADYQKAGVTDEARLRPLLAARAASQHADFLGVWTGKVAVNRGVLRAPKDMDFCHWVIDLDERTGGLQVAGREYNALFRGENVNVKNSVLSFVAVRVDQDENQVGSGGSAPKTLALELAPNYNGEWFAYVGSGSVPRTLTLKDGTLRSELKVSPPQKPPSKPTKTPPPKSVYKSKNESSAPRTSKSPGSAPPKSNYGSRNESTALRTSKPAEAAPPKSIGEILEHNEAVGERFTLSIRLEAVGDYALDHKAPERSAEKLDVTDATAVWRKLAALSSFDFYRGDNYKKRFYSPAPKKQGSPAMHELAGIMAFMGKGAPADADPAPTSALLGKYEAITASPNAYLKRAAEQALAIRRTRIRLDRANSRFGNTPDSQIQAFQQNVISPAVQYQLQREADIEALQETLDRQITVYGGRIEVIDAPLSAESEQKLHEFVLGPGKFKESIQQSAVVSGLLDYARMAQVDRNIAFWQTWLMPLVKRCSGPASDKPLVEIDGTWNIASNAGKDRFQRLDNFRLRNVAAQDLTHVVVRVLAENEWGERAAHFYYFPQLEVGEVDLLLPHPRWDKRRLPFTNSLTATCSVWSDQGSSAGRSIKLSSPAPNPDAKTVRKDFLDQDKKYQAEGEAFGTVVQTLIALPADPAWLKRRLRAAADPGSTYIFRVPGEGKAVHTLVLRFVRFDEGPDGIEAEILDAKSRKLYQESTSIWKGKLEPDSEAAIGFGTAAHWKQPDWAFGFGNDDGLKIICLAGGSPGATFPVKDIPLFAVKAP